MECFAKAIKSFQIVSINWLKSQPSKFLIVLNNTGEDTVYDWLQISDCIDEITDNCI
jgi:hypothetical protein